MDDYVNFKMRSGEDLVGILIEKGDDFVRVQRPLHILVHPHHGFFVKTWNMFAEGNIVKINNIDMIWCEKANERAIQYYDDFLQQIDESTDGTSTKLRDDFDSDIEDTLEAMLDSRHQIKH